MTTNQKGIGIVQILMALGILGGLALVIGRFSNEAGKVTTNVETNNDIVGVIQQIQAVLSDPESCSTTFLGKRANNSINVVQSLRVKHNGVFTNAFDTKSTNPTLSFGQQNLKILSYALSDADDEVDVPTLGTTHLLINFDRGTKGSQAQSIAKKVSLRVNVNASGDIVSCVAFSTSSSDLWKYSLNNSDIFYSGGNVAINTSVSNANLTVRATTMPGTTPGIAIIGNEASNAGWNRSNITFWDQSSSYAWSVGMYGSASYEGEGKIGINGGPKNSPLPNRFIITKEGDVGVGITDPGKGFDCIPSIICPNSIDFQFHNPSTDSLYGGGNLILSSNATGNGAVVGSLAMGTMSSINLEKRIAVVQGQINNFSPLRGQLLFWTTNGGIMDIGMVIGPTGDLWTKREITTTALNVSSDARLKENVRPFSNGLEKILSLNPVSFQWKDKEKPGHQLGFIAQEVEKIFPELVRVDEHGIKSVAYMELLAPIVNAIEELHHKILLGQNDIQKLEQDGNKIRSYFCARDPNAEFCREGRE
ncbi:tail fiber domain-containing protein [Peredibacter sp. HCB2-198]|uniref:tail fiber domain-containing protein n=1 Tax=Peredibacter sp. HCB2-198 TaxID=3383025 RepID=UPI0038B57CBF